LIEIRPAQQLGELAPLIGRPGAFLPGKTRRLLQPHNIGLGPPDDFGRLRQRLLPRVPADPKVEGHDAHRLGGPRVHQSRRQQNKEQPSAEQTRSPVSAARLDAWLNAHD
jgi:hypothetical protein